MTDYGALKILGQGLNFVHRLGILPYRYDRETNRFLCVKSKSKSCWRRLVASLVLLALYQIFLCVQCGRTLTDPKSGRGDKIKNAYVTAIYLLLNSCHVITLKNYGSHHVYINAFLDTAQRCHQKLEAEAGNAERMAGRKSEGSSKILFCVCFLNILITAAARGLGVWRKPQSRELVTSLAHSPNDLPVWTKVLASILHCYLAAFHTFFLIFHGLTFFLQVLGTLRVLKLTLRDDDEVKGQEKSAEKGLQLSRGFLYQSFIELSVLQENWSEVYGDWPLYGGDLITLLFVVANLYMGILLHNPRNIWIAVVAGGGTLTFFSRCADVFATSKSAIHSWKGMVKRSEGVAGSWSEVKWFAKFIRSCRPIRIKLGNFFFVDRSFVLTLISVIISSTTNLVLFTK